MFALTREEQIFVVALMLTILLGVIVKHEREKYRLAHPVVESATPRPKPGYVDIKEKRPSSSRR